MSSKAIHCACPEALQEDGMEFWRGLLYDFQDICHAVARHEGDKAVRLLGERLEKLAQQGFGGDHPEGGDSFLEALNQSLYDYFLFVRGISLHQCRHANGALTRAFGCAEAQYRRGEAIILSYCDALEEGTAHKARIQRATTYIDANLAENISLDDVCGWACVSRCRFCQMFKSCTGSTFSEYLTHRRIQRAKSLLIESGLSSQDIARRCGFSSASYFTTVFRKQTGFPPARYRALHRRHEPLLEIV